MESILIVYKSKTGFKKDM